MLLMFAPVSKLRKSGGLSGGDAGGSFCGGDKHPER